MKNPLLLNSALARAHDALDLHAMQVVVAPSAWAEIVRELVAELKPKEPVTSVDYHPV
jgi:hypothetical protein